MTTQPEQQTTAPEVVALPKPTVRIPKHNPMRRGLVVKPPPLDLWDEVAVRAYADAKVCEAEARIVAWLAERAEAQVQIDEFNEGVAQGWRDASSDLSSLIERGEHRA